MNKQKSRLGRGLSSLISLPAVDEKPSAASLPDSPAMGASGPETSAAVDATVTSDGLREVDLDHVSANPHQPRRIFDQESLDELARSIHTAGVVQPIIVRQVGNGFELIAGERRLRAAKLAGLRRIPAIVRSAEPSHQAELALIENIHRQDLNPLDRANAYHSLMELLGVGQSELAERLGEDRSTIAHHLRLLELKDEVRALVQAGSLSLGHAKALSGVSDAGRQIALADRCVADAWSVRALERAIKQPVSVSTPRMDESPKAHLRDLERNISAQLQLRVKVRTAIKQKGAGALVVKYGSLEEFDQLMARLGVKLD